MIDMRTGGYVLVQAKAVLLATGGGPTMYKYHTPSGDKSCDGLAMALRAGLPLRDMEMVQFHPTGLLAGGGTRMTGTVLEEGLRGAGGWLLNGAGERFMQNYHPNGERATRDIVSRSIYSEMRAGRTSPNGGVYIQMHHLGADSVRRQFKGMVERCADCGFDLAGGQVEVVPTAHYMMGGVVFRLDCRTPLPGLYAAGEDTGGVHGANRLGGNGVANSTVFGGIAGETMAADLGREVEWREPDEAVIRRSIEEHEAPFAAIAGHRPCRGQLPATSVRSARHSTRPCGTTSASCVRRRGSPARSSGSRRSMRRCRQRALPTMTAPSTSAGTTGSTCATSSPSAALSRRRRCRAKIRGAHTFARISCHRRPRPFDLHRRQPSRWASCAEPPAGRLQPREAGRVAACSGGSGRTLRRRATTEREAAVRRQCGSGNRDQTRDKEWRR